ncbi:MAG: polysaccharide pyruvyl transferase family protein [Clostridiales bacterium]|jgi:coenzyme F420-reducing hydrogenase beta subunit|nr:polysaccharide pyruvyl transferase family protein [Clostridiales bacterium]
MKTHYDAAVLDFGWGMNYGSLLNGYATRSILKNLGYSVLHIQKPGAKEDDWEINGTHNYDFALRHYRDDISPFLPLSRMSELNNLCDMFIAGSDQIFNPYFSGSWAGYSFYLDFVDNSKKLASFGTSFGTSFGSNYNNSRDKTNKIARLLRNFNALSVREQASATILRDTYGVEAQVVAEPVFLLDIEKWRKLAEHSALDVFAGDEPYMLTYILDPTPEKRAAIEYYSGLTGLTAINILDGRSDLWVQNNEKLNLPNTPSGVIAEDFLKGFINASFVLTDSFHGMAFSVVFKKKFISITNRKRGFDRFGDVLGEFGLLHRYTTEEKNIPHSEKLLEDIDFSKVEEVIKSKRDSSIEWLKTALETPVDIKVKFFLPKPFYGIETYKSKSSDPYFVLSKDKCTGCAACYNACPVNCITMVEDNEGFLYPRSVDKKKCLDCGKCKRVCPVLNPPERVRSNIKPKNVYAAYSLDEQTRFMSTSGGAFSEFARYALANGGVVYGAAYDEDFAVYHVRSEDEKGLARIRQSKYYQSEIKDTYKRVLDDLESGRIVLFGGTPCQCAALDSFLKRDYEHLILVDFICHSVCPKLAFKAYLSELEHKYGAPAERVWFKNKQNGWHRFSLRIDFKGKFEYYMKPSGSDDYFKAFLKYRLFLRPSCHGCMFKENKRSADITLADFWGLKWNDPNHHDDQEQGVSIIMTRTDKGQRIFGDFVSPRVYSEKHELVEVVPRNGGMIHSQTVGLYRDYFFQNIGEFKFSKILALMDERERLLQIERDKPSITGKLTKIGNVIITMAERSKIIIDPEAELILNANLPEGSQKECILTLHPGAILHVTGKFRVSYDSRIILWNNAKMTVANGFVNFGAAISPQREIIIGDDFLAGSQIAIWDYDSHKIIEAESGDILNNPTDAIKIGKHVWMGLGSMITDSVSVGEGAIIAAKAVVTHNVPENSIVAGVPAKVIKTGVTWRV